ncbi:MAG: 50S ribosomal protein L28 [Candidatus Schekmanbacteria bacterium RIFCSPHIGHO2_02_FULL_38_11]|uniref:Large ribosomal subunit protein bL28 n=1 Tax=Candidatus Schekmanbacteria bacterium RIFCSPLOWO2_12_FULL_38_15 TaxID=1817883 RepID=A0A1F7SDZ9_9BACT|nr:MAG: 50S ribosomal protein L28 [Candidatus Schekmanbacteria bacterium GWA2_38_9]OGL49933.1 MAG: 50S ribosomal protein L28 [Candidatus Schekmanbacteria bacterium RIFCSPLOWO2_02_FULL_38_14]OGL51673.1 MAG: 50S ribosomal protein L28 [Candidatus Schekmanbacteria bacterium RIFCSPHIGHO2_02_FULL_38_11]OGL51951.1 MAG: 50S ribosomal protein L28 [Candidatus Schekmanbacteria bacterium RIFCSPLOWO2_12_FULL_38_15]
MAQRCDICGKGPMYGHNISHAHNVSNRRFNPNLQNRKVLINGTKKTIKVCTRCIRSGAVVAA